MQSSQRVAGRLGSVVRPERHLGDASNSRHRGAKVVRNGVERAPHADDQGVIPVEHAVEESPELVQLVAGRTGRHPSVHGSGLDGLNRLNDLSDRAEGPEGEEYASGGAEQEHRYQYARHGGAKLPEYGLAVVRGLPDLQNGAIRQTEGGDLQYSATAPRRQGEPLLAGTGQGRVERLEIELAPASTPSDDVRRVSDHEANREIFRHVETLLARELLLHREPAAVSIEAGQLSELHGDVVSISQLERGRHQQVGETEQHHRAHDEERKGPHCEPEADRLWCVLKTLEGHIRCLAPCESFSVTTRRRPWSAGGKSGPRRRWSEDRSREPTRAGGSSSWKRDVPRSAPGTRAGRTLASGGRGLSRPGSPRGSRGRPRDPPR